MYLWAVHEVCRSRRKDVFSDRFWSEVVRVRAHISISIGHISEDAIVTSFGIVPPPAITSLFLENTFGLEDTTDRSPCTWEEILDGEMVP